MFDFVQPLETLDSLSSAFDDTLNKNVITATGSGFTADDIAGTELYLDGVKQETLTVSPTEATFAVNDALDSASTNAVVYFVDGLPTNYESKTFVEMEPKLISISPSTGSAGGTLLTVTGAGFGVDTNGVNLAIQGGD